MTKATQSHNAAYYLFFWTPVKMPSGALELCGNSLRDASMPPCELLQQPTQEKPLPVCPPALCLSLAEGHDGRSWVRVLQSPGGKTVNRRQSKFPLHLLNSFTCMFRPFPHQVYDSSWFPNTTNVNNRLLLPRVAFNFPPLYLPPLNPRNPSKHLLFVLCFYRPIVLTLFRVFA